MGMRELEAEILAEARKVSRNTKLRQKDIREWSTGLIMAQADEVVIRCPDIGVNVSVFKTMDKRK